GVLEYWAHRSNTPSLHYSTTSVLLASLEPRREPPRLPCVKASEDTGGGKMPRCETCGNEYDKSFQVLMDGQTHTFDSFECAIHMLAPSCAHCGCKILGHGVEGKGQFFCCAN